LDKKEIIKRLRSIFKNIFDNPELEINEFSSAENITEWDSLNHIYLIVEIEKSFDIKFTTEQIQNWQNVGEMAEFLSNQH